MNFRLTGFMTFALALMGTAQAASVFEGRAANGTVDLNCTPHFSDAAGNATNICAMFYYRSLDITILNIRSGGPGNWSTSGAANSAQTLAEKNGFEITGLHGWFLPTGDGTQPAGAANQYRSIWEATGGSLAGLQAQFEGVKHQTLWSGTQYTLATSEAWMFNTLNGSQYHVDHQYSMEFFVVRPGDVAAAVPEPQTYALMLAGLGLVVGGARRRSKQQ